jgi:hypothetical protein
MMSSDSDDRDVKIAIGAFIIGILFTLFIIYGISF